MREQQYMSFKCVFKSQKFYLVIFMKTIERWYFLTLLTVLGYTFIYFMLALSVQVSINLKTSKSSKNHSMNIKYRGYDWLSNYALNFLLHIYHQATHVHFSIFVCVRLVSEAIIFMFNLQMRCNSKVKWSFVKCICQAQHTSLLCSVYYAIIEKHPSLMFWNRELSVYT